MRFCYFIGIAALLMLLCGRIQAQPYLVQGSIEYAGEGSIYLASYYGDRFRIVDSVENSGGTFHFLLSEEVPAGIFRLIYPEVYQGIRSENRFVEFIYNHTDISFNVSLDQNRPLPGFENSVENQVYFEFMSFQLDYEAKLSSLYGRLSPAMPGDSSYESVVRQYEELQIGRKAYMESQTELYPELYATRIMNAFRAPVVSGTMSHHERIDSLKRLFFDVAPIDDPALLCAPVYTFRLVEYLSLFRVDTFTVEQQELQFMEAVDRILVNVAPVPELRSFVVEFLLDGFELLGMEQVQLHLADHYLDESCESDVAELVKIRMEGYRRMSVGATAPDFTFRDILGKNHTLSEMPDSLTLVMFWASTCQHCREMISDLQSWYLEENTRGVEVVAISIDSSAALLQKYIEEQELPWITIHDPLGWNGKVPGDYNIYLTPSLFLLDRERRILARPVSFRQFYRFLNKLEN
ncbi:MAG: AhpC/TSA family protein [Bacteroidetes bacterium]|nr:AhpC/TSA family protein [Bacteroidota bacterium]